MTNKLNAGEVVPSSPSLKRARGSSGASSVVAKKRRRPTDTSSPDQKDNTESISQLEQAAIGLDVATSPKPKEVNLTQAPGHICAACSRPIREKYLLSALDKSWHEDCLKCAGCDCRLGEVGSSLFLHPSGKIFCRRDFLRIFGQPGRCAACKRPIPPYDLVMKVLKGQRAYHIDCFNCHQCGLRFCVGDRFHLMPDDSDWVICEPCHLEQLQRPADNSDGHREREASERNDLQDAEQRASS